MSSILDDIKHILGIPKENQAFDLDIMIHVNSVFATLHQLGVGPVEGFAIEDAEAQWNQFTDGLVTLNSVKSYMFLKVKLIFDPPKTGFELSAIERQITELEYRLNVVADYG